MKEGKAGVSLVSSPKVNPYSTNISSIWKTCHLFQNLYSKTPREDYSSVTNLLIIVHFFFFFQHGENALAPCTSRAAHFQCWWSAHNSFLSHQNKWCHSQIIIKLKPGIWEMREFIGQQLSVYRTRIGRAYIIFDVCEREREDYNLLNIDP